MAGRSKAAVEIAIEADVVPLTKGVDRSMMALERLKSALGQFASAAAIVGAARAIANFATELNRMALSSGATVEWLQKAGNAIRLMGGSMTGLGDSVAHLRQAMEKAFKPNAPELEAFRELGIAMEDLKGKNAQEIFERIASSLERSQGSAQKLAAALRLLGPSGRETIPGMMSGFGAKLAAGNGAGMSSETAMKWQMAMGGMGTQVDQAKGQAAEFLAGPWGKTVARLVNLRFLPSLIAGSIGRNPLSPMMAAGDLTQSMALLDAGTAGTFGRFDRQAKEAVRIQELLAQIPDPEEPARTPRQARSVPSLDAFAKKGYFLGGGYQGPVAMPIQAPVARAIGKLDRRLVDIQKAIEQNTSVTRDSGL